MRVLVTGASGFVGQHVTRALRERGDDVIACGHAGQLQPEVIDVDLRRRDALDRWDLRSVDAVIHLAGLAQVSASFDQPAEYISENSSMQINLIEALRRQASAPRVLVISSGAVYAGGQELITEESRVRASNPYVISKLTQELLASYYGERGLDVMIARPFNHIGPGQQRGFLVSDVASQVASLERSGGGELVVGDLEPTRDFTDVRDIAAAYVELLRSGERGEIYNVCSGSSVSAREVVAELVGLANAPIRVVVDSKLQRPTETLRVTASSEKLRRATGWRPRLTLSTTLSDVLDYWREVELRRS